MAFPAEMIRISKNLARDTYDDIRGNTAARLGIKNKEAQKQLKNMGYKRLAGMTATATAGDQLGNYSANLMGITGEDQESLQRLQPTWEQGTAKIYLSDFNKEISRLKSFFPNELFKIEKLTEEIKRNFNNYIDQKVFDQQTIANLKLSLSEQLKKIQKI